MKEAELKKLSIHQLKEKIRSLWIFIGVFMVVIGGYIFSFVEDYWNGIAIDSNMFIIMICSIGGMISLFPGLNALRRELTSRN
ncbi:MAG: hypothetical protein AB8G86_25390 [Saprospiraceae bacterium]